MVETDSRPFLAASSLRQSRARVAFAAAAGLALIGFAATGNPAPRLVWNASASAPIGLYRVLPQAPIAVGDTVLARTPARVRELADLRHYVPASVPLVKRVAAASGARVCAVGDLISIDGRPAATRMLRDFRGRAMPWWSGCRTLGSDEYLLLNQAPASFDSRYFGPVSSAGIIGKAVPLWLR